MIYAKYFTTKRLFSLKMGENKKLGWIKIITKILRLIYFIILIFYNVQIPIKLLNKNQSLLKF